MTTPIDAPWTLSYRLTVGHEPLDKLWTDRQADTSTDNKGRLKLAACEPTVLIIGLHYILVFSHIGWQHSRNARCVKHVYKSTL